MDNKNVLPSLPESDPQSLAWNKKSDFYTIIEDGKEKPLGAREFWGKNNITTHKLEDFKKCDHSFKLNKGWFRCQHCHFGLEQSITHPLTISNNGQLLHEGKPLF